jgi:hypothetical protein
LAALSDQSLASDAYEVIVSVDGPGEEFVSLVEDIRPPYRYRIIGRTRRGRASACNAGIEIAAGDVIVLLDDDMEPAPQFLRAHLEAHRERPRRAVLGAAPVRTMPDDPPVAGYVAAKFDRHLQALSAPGHRWTLRDFYTGNFSIRRDTLAQVGHFDERFAAYGNEDLELFWRLRRDGVEVTYCAAALAWQRYTKSLESFARDSWEKGKTAVQLADKFPEALAELQLASYGKGPLALRLARRAAVTAGRIFPWLSTLVVEAAGVFERSALPGRRKMYELVANYLYWMGVFAALDEADGVCAAVRHPLFPSSSGEESSTRAHRSQDC